VSTSKKAECRRATARDNAGEFKVINGAEVERVFQTVNVSPHANYRFESNFKRVVYINIFKSVAI
jgi:fatty acid synthase subunit beta